MSDLELSDAPMRPLPSNAALEKGLRRETAKQASSEPTVNTIRQGVERVLGLEDGFFKGHDTWKAKSKSIITDEIQKQQDVPELSPHTISANNSPAKPKAAKPPVKAAPKRRPSPSGEKPARKRQKKSLPKDDSEGDLSSPPPEDSEDDFKPKVKNMARMPKTKDKPPAEATKASETSGETKPKSKPKPKTQKPDSELFDAPPEDTKLRVAPESSGADSGSELSVLIDDEPRPTKKRQSKESSGKPKAVKTKPGVQSDDPDQEEIQRLQGWLVKCGIRKIWAFELKPYETSKAKINHLKKMLSDVGMSGRYSLDKAAQIKEARELAADIEAVQEGNEIWGKDGEDRSRRSKRSDYAEPEDEDEADAVPKRSLVRGPKRYDFLSSDGEESD